MSDTLQELQLGSDGRISPVVSDEAKKLHADFVAEIRKRQVSSSENFDKSVLTLSSAGLAFSLGFVKDFVPIGAAVAPWVLYASWGALTAATCLTMLSFLASAKAQEAQQRKADRYYLANDDDAFASVNPWDRITIWLNRLSGATFLGGVVLTTVFVATNLERAQVMKDSKHMTQDGPPAPAMSKVVTEGSLQKGLPAPSLTARPPAAPPSSGPGSSPAGTPAPTTAPQGRGNTK